MTNEQERANLLPCPFCGKSKNLMVQHCEGTIIHPAYRIYCDYCGASNGYTDRGDHVEEWNRRAALQSKDREEIKEVIERLPRYSFGNISDEWGAGQYLGAVRHDNGRFLRVDEVMVAIDHAHRINEDKS